MQAGTALVSEIQSQEVRLLLLSLLNSRDLRVLFHFSSSILSVAFVLWQADAVVDDTSMEIEHQAGSGGQACPAPEAAEAVEEDGKLYVQNKKTLDVLYGKLAELNRRLDNIAILGASAMATLSRRWRGIEKTATLFYRRRAHVLEHTARL